MTITQLSTTQVSVAIEQGLSEGIEALGREVGLIQRQSKITATALLHGLVFGYLENPECSDTQIAQSVARAGSVVTAQAVQARLTRVAAVFFEQVLARLTRIVVTPASATQTILNRFSQVNVDDSTTLQLPDALRAVWSGCGSGSGHGEAALKMQVEWDLRNGDLRHMSLHDGRSPDRSAPMQSAPVVANSLRLADLGYFDLSVFERIDQAQAFWLSRYMPGVNVYAAPEIADARAPALDLPRWLPTPGVVPAAAPDVLDACVHLGAKHRLRCRLIAMPVPLQVAAERRRKLRRNAQRKGHTASAASLALAAWSIFLTNAPQSLLSVQDVLILARARWQIELLFKLWKSVGGIDHSRSSRPWRVLCELFAKMIAVLLQHWLMLYTLWSFPDRSFTKAALALRPCAVLLLVALHKSLADLVEALDIVARSIATTCRVNTRVQHPALFQLLADGDA